MTEKLVGLIGWPVAHSVSPAVHNAAFAALGMQEWRYLALPVPSERLPIALNKLKRQGYVGLNVTLPHKRSVVRLCRYPDEETRAIGAANVIDLRGDRAFNTDVCGFMEDLEYHGIMVSGTTALVLGAGGAARAAVYGLARCGARVVVVNRSAARAQEMAAELPVPFLIATPGEVVRREKISLVVNCTCAGMWPDVESCPWTGPLPEGATVYDMVYTPEETALIAMAKRSGLRAIGGLGMLIRQAARAFTLWTGVNPPPEVMLTAARSALRKGSL